MTHLLYVETNVNDVKHKLNGKYLELKSEYEDIYTLSFITPELSKNGIALVSRINDMFSEYSMVKYFGNKKDLNCTKTRFIYEKLISYYINLFILKMFECTNININVIDQNDKYVCLLAQCTNIIRAGIKKYARLRTSLSQTECSKDKLNKSNHTKYNCNLPIGPYDQCPSFEHLHRVRGKTCKQIIKSSKSPSILVSLAARSLPSCGKRKNIRNITFKRNITKTRRRRHIKNSIRENIELLNMAYNNMDNNDNNDTNTSYKSVHIVNTKNIPEISNK